MLTFHRRRSGLRQRNKAGKMPHKRAKAVGKLLFFDKKTTPRSIDRFGLKTIILNNSNEGEVYKIIFYFCKARIC